MSSNIPPLPVGDLLQQHPPERGERKKKYVVLYSCCCCCCCCLHTLGGAIGAVVAGNYCPERDEWDESPQPAKRLPCSQWMFWSSFLFACLAGAVIGGLSNPSDFSDALIVVGLSIVILGPAWFLAASGLSALQIAFRKDLPNKREYLRKLGKITVGMLAGSVLGVLAMVLIGVAIMGLGGR